MTAKDVGSSSSCSTVPERRVIRYAVFDRASTAAQAVPAEAEIAADYKSNATLYQGSQVRGLTQAVIADQASANAVLARIKGGQSFADALKPLGLEPLTVAPSNRRSASSSSASILLSTSRARRWNRRAAKSSPG